MTPSNGSSGDAMWIVLPLASDVALGESDFGKLTLHLSDGVEPEEVAILDCFDGTLRKAGLLLLHSGEQLQLMGPSGGVLEEPGGRDVGFVVNLPDSELKAALSVVSPLRRLIPIGAAWRQIRTLTVLDDEGKTRARAQLTVVTTEKGGCVIARLQGLRGYDKALAQLRKALMDLGGVSLQEADLHGILFPGQTVHDPKPQVTIGYEEPAIEVATHIMAAYIPVARANEAGVIADLDTEFLHDYRIALRKIRSVISLFKGVYGPEGARELKHRFSALMAQTGRLRDLDVYLLDRQETSALVPPSVRRGLDRMFDLFEAERGREHKRLAQYLKTKAYEAEIGALAKLLAKPRKLGQGPNAQRPAHDYAADLIWKRYRKICKIASGIGPDTDDEQVHELRIHCKKLRYLLEFFGPVFPKKAFKTILKPLKRLQDNLGYFNDYSVQQDSLRAFLDDLEGPHQIEIAQSVGALIAVLHGRQLEERSKVMDSFARFDSDETRALFRRLFRERKDTE
ncbi:MAG: CHAD domain-containing protein [Rhodobacteraceae bacterium]|nr:CHAD domain-containing protein [Paracoccaceae bacterium]